jgi:hypothetical protein
MDTLEDLLEGAAAIAHYRKWSVAKTYKEARRVKEGKSTFPFIFENRRLLSRKSLIDAHYRPPTRRAHGGATADNVATSAAAT